MLLARPDWRPALTGGNYAPVVGFGPCVRVPVRPATEKRGSSRCCPYREPDARHLDGAARESKPVRIMLLNQSDCDAFGSYTTTADYRRCGKWRDFCDVVDKLSSRKVEAVEISVRALPRACRLGLRGRRRFVPADCFNQLGDPPTMRRAPHCQYPNKDTIASQITSRWLRSATRHLITAMPLPWPRWMHLPDRGVLALARNTSAGGLLQALSSKAFRRSLG